MLRVLPGGPNITKAGHSKGVSRLCFLYDRCKRAIASFKMDFSSLDPNFINQQSQIFFSEV